MELSHLVSYGEARGVQKLGTGVFCCQLCDKPIVDRAPEDLVKPSDGCSPCPCLTATTRDILSQNNLANLFPNLGPTENVR